jgi:hypothetical protein
MGIPSFDPVNSRFGTRVTSSEWGYPPAVTQIGLIVTGAPHPHNETVTAIRSVIIQSYNECIL